MKLDFAKTLTLLFWLLVLVTPFAGFPEMAVTGIYLTSLGMAVAHTGEFFYFRKEVASKQGDKLEVFLLTFFFGVLYLKNWPAEPWK